MAENRSAPAASPDGAAARATRAPGQGRAGNAAPHTAGSCPGDARPWRGFVPGAGWAGAGEPSPAAVAAAWPSALGGVS